MTSSFSHDPEADIARLEYRLAQLDLQERARNNFLDFVRYVWPQFICGRHHKIMAEKFEALVEGKNNRIIINIAPRHGKSELTSYLFLAWLMGRAPSAKIIQATHTAELAMRFGRKVRNLMDTDAYKEVFPDVMLAADSKAAGRFETNHGGEYFAAGVGGAMTGRGADYLVIDDPHSEQDALSETAMERAYEWYTSGPRQRLQPGGKILLVMCMTGDTLVLMADGTEKLLKNIRPNDMVATFDKGRLSASKINNWRSSGIDQVYKIQTQSGRILRANERHPFLVLNEEVLEWTRLKHLQAGDLLVSLKGAVGQPEQKQNPESVQLVKHESPITEKTPILRTGHWDITDNGREQLVLRKGVTLRSALTACVKRIMASVIGLQGRGGQPQRNEGRTELKAGTGSRLSNMRTWLQSATTAAMSVANRHQRPIPERTGTASCASTIATTQEKSGGCYATTATSQLGMARRRMFLNELHRISDFTADPVVSITADGEEEVFDVEVDRTENFIANGVVSHNTRWSKADLTGKVLADQAKDSRADKWEVIEFPAIMPSGKPCWPEYWKLQDLEAVRAALPVSKWNAQWQQNPTAEEGAIFKREWWRKWTRTTVPPLQYVIQSYDTAYSKKETADFSAITTWGVFCLEPDDPAQLILLDAKKGRWDFPELKRVAMELYKFWDPDCVLIEAKASGLPLSQELRRTGIPVVNYSPGGRNRATDKVSRANSVSPVFEAGFVWVPDEPWAEELVEEMAEFPYGENDDLTDSAVQAVIRFRQGNFLTLPSDYEEDEAGPVQFSYY